MASAAALVPISAASARNPSVSAEVRRQVRLDEARVGAQELRGGDPLRRGRRVGEERAADRREGDERRPERRAGLHQPELGRAGRERVFRLHRRHRMHRRRPPQRRGRDLGEADGAGLAGADQLGERPGHLLDRHLRVAAMDVEEIDRLDPEPLQAALELGREMRRPNCRTTAARSPGRGGPPPWWRCGSGALSGKLPIMLSDTPQP